MKRHHDQVNLQKKELLGLVSEGESMAMMVWWTSQWQASLAVGPGLGGYILRQQQRGRKVGVGRERERKRETGKAVGFR